MAKRSGFCGGVRRAVDRALAEAREHGAARTLGPLVHNREVVRDLENRGVTAIESLDGARDRVVIRAHGVRPEVYREAAARGIQVLDATCPLVRRAQERAAELTGEGYRVVVVGQPDHPEVQGIVGWGGEGTLVIRNAAEAEGLPEGECLAIVCQTTLPPQILAEVVERVQAMGRKFTLENTICPATRERQAEIEALANRVDVLIVVGGRNSSNTQALAAAGRRAGVPTYLVEDAGELRAEWFSGCRRAGVAGGASTPDWILKEVVATMEEIRDTNKEELVPVAEGETAPCEAEAAAQAGPQAEPPVEMPAEAPVEAEPNYQETFGALSEGQIVRGKVVYVGKDNVLVDVGYKSEGTIPLDELSHRPVEMPEQVVNIGDEIDVYVLSVEGKEGGLVLSKKRADEENAWKSLQSAFETGEVIEAPVTEQVKGGLVVDVGVRGFVPASQVERGYVSDLAKYVNGKVRVRVIELDRGKHRAILSQKVVLEEEYARRREQTWAELEEGQVRTGVVKSITDFGAFIDLGGVDGLLHVSEMSWGRVGHPSEVLKEGETVKVKVLRLDREKQKISLGLKQVLPDPWDTVEGKYPVGTVVTGKVVRLVSFGAFVQLEPGVEGLVHISQMADHRVNTPDEVVSEGQTVKVKVIKVSGKERRISLSLKEVEQDRERAAAREYMNGKGEDAVTIGEVVGDILGETREGE